MLDLRVTIKFFVIAILMVTNLSFLSDTLFKFHISIKENNTTEFVDVNHLEERVEESHVGNTIEKEVEERVLCHNYHSFNLSTTTTFHILASINISSELLEIVSPPPKYIV